MESTLRSEPGIRTVQLDLENGRLSLQYDPRRVSLRRVQHLSREIGVVLGQQFERCTRRIRGVRCADCAERYERGIDSAPGVARVSVNPAAQVITVEYDPKATDLPSVEQQIIGAGFSVEPPPGTRAAYRAAEARDRTTRLRMGALTVVCLLALIVGWVLQAIEGPPESTVLAIFLVAYFAGGAYSTVRVVRELGSGVISVDLLMIAAALGAAAIGNWRDICGSAIPSSCGRRSGSPPTGSFASARPPSISRR
jgi:copper chaperone CopZ